jgi:K+-sensing histidine kinase KdpD
MANADNASPDRAPHVLVCVAGGKDDLRLMRHGELLARRLSAPLTVLYVLCDATGPRPAEALSGIRCFAEAMGAPVVEEPAYSVIDGIAEHAALRAVTHLVISEAERTPWYAVWRGSFLNDLLVRLPAGVDVFVLGESDLRRNVRSN